MNPFSYLIIIFCAFIGFFISWYIRHKKTRREHLVCPLYQKCDQVIHSQFAFFLGIPIELIGIIYYLTIAIGYALMLAVPAIASPGFIFAIFGLSTCAFLFSVYLTFIQAFTLREFCSWCLTSASLCTIIFLTGASHILGDIVGFMQAAKPVIVVVHLLAASLGLGAATIADIFFFRFLKDFKISEFEADVLHILSQIIWAALAIILLSGISLYLPQLATLHQSVKFLLKMVIVAVILTNGSILNLFISPRLVRISFGEHHDHIRGELHYIRKIAFALGSISIVSWYSAFILGALRRISLDFTTALSVYLAMLIFGIICSQIAERHLSRKAFERP